MNTPAAGTPLIEVSGLKKYFPVKRGVLARHVADVKAVDGVSFVIQPQETLSLVGESGCGKTTCGRTLLRLLEPTAGSVRYSPEKGPALDLFSLPRAEMRRVRRDLQIIFQDPYSSLNPRMTVGNIVGEALLVHKICTKHDVADTVADLLVRVGLHADSRNRFPHEFSGGQRQRVGIARALALGPRLVVCDEAVSALDVSIQAQVLNLLKDLQEEFKLGYLFIAHDLSVVRYLSDRIAVMYLGRIVEIGTTAEIFENPQHPYTQALLSAVPHADPGAKSCRVPLSGDVPSPMNPPAGCHFAPRCPVSEARCTQSYPEHRSASETHRVACHLFD
ncbi:MAG: oligopeptide/dipeptide ABC transporter ATP-binding protein [bacterium]|jgi:oligopeptide/dipeptide ABC transporter ATP-binding protein|nr:ATP-binding cassette domain-containing protein [Planctomycetota bacterium]HIL51383.1 ATP-binding cassette domain-containing protein [Planctomycetota bacterium]